MKNSALVFDRPAKVQDSQFITPTTRPTMRVISTHKSIHPDYQEKIDQYTSKLNESVTDRFIDDPVLLSSVYEFLGFLPFEIQDIEKNVRAGEFRMALFEIDDMIEKAITWRIKLSHKAGL